MIFCHVFGVVAVALIVMSLMDVVGYAVGVAVRLQLDADADTDTDTDTDAVWLAAAGVEGDLR